MKIKKLMLLTLVTGVIAQVSHTMEAQERETILSRDELQPEIKITKEGYVAAATRLSIVKQLCKKHPGLTPNIPIHSDDFLWPLYQADLAFIQKSVDGQKRSNKEAIQTALSHVHQKAQSLGWDKKMSFWDLSLIGQLWVQILSSSEESLIHAVLDKNGDPNPARGLTKYISAQQVLSAFMNRSKIEYINARFASYEKDKDLRGDFVPWVQFKGFVMPHVSPTGACPLSVIRESWGFFTQEDLSAEKRDASCLDFWAVPTNTVANFDHYIDYPPCDSWYHDEIHSFRYRYRNQYSNLEMSRRAAIMLSGIKSAKMKTEDLQKLDIAFFHVFHESITQISELGKEIGKKRAEVAKILQSEIKFGGAFENQNQVQSYVESTERLLGQKLEGKTLVDQYKSYLRLLSSGLDILEKFAALHDDLKKG